MSLAGRELISRISPCCTIRSTDRYNVPALSFEVRSHLSNLSETTGGKVYFVERAEELAEIYGEIERELRSRYYLAYESEKSADEYGYRPVEVRVKRGGKVRTARGYYP